VARLRTRVHAATAQLMVTPENNGSVPAVLKNAIDRLSRPRRSAPPRDKTSSVEAHLEQILALAGAHVLPTPGRAISVKTFRGQLPDDAENVTEAVAQAWRGLRPVTLGG